MARSFVSSATESPHTLFHVAWASEGHANMCSHEALRTSQGLGMARKELVARGRRREVLLYYRPMFVGPHQRITVGIATETGTVE